MCRSRHINPKTSSEEKLVLIPNEHATTQATGTPAASAAANTVVASSATTGSSSASASVVTSTVTTSGSPKRHRSLGEYKKARGNVMFARVELEARFDVGSDVDMENGEVDEETPSSTRDSLRSDGTGIRKLPVEAECPSGRYYVKAGVLLLKTSTRTQLVTVSAFT
ncbi:unnamed protein product [Phytophthora fragariaefolia]|uniref:Unnamed protein product n=1 Tax=Phytophthora fragariaefolia TaxID=1490495 RepID=A0A9W6X0F1_9STRA|nr:unnamed protein product [Phytophthora fragariaefolia]